MLLNVRFYSVLVVVLSSIGCGTTFQEKYHFRAVAKDGSTNYYRVLIDGNAWFSESQYASGLYDKGAVDSLFGELKGAKITATTGLRPEVKPDAGDAKKGDETGAKQPTPAADGSTSGSPSPAEAAANKLIAKNSKTPSPPGAEAGRLESLDGTRLENQRLVLFLSSNSNAIVNQIKAFVRNEQMQNSLVQLIGKEEAQTLQVERAKTRAAQARADKLASELEVIAATIEADSNLTQAEVNAAMIQAWTTLSRSSAAPASPLPFPDTATARTWNDGSPTAFEAGE